MAKSTSEDQGPEGAAMHDPVASQSRGQGHVKRLHRSSDQRILLGVCGGLGEYFDIDPVLVRIVFVLLVFAGFSGVLLYVILAFIMPSEENLDAHPRDAARSTLDEAVEGSRGAVNRASDWVRSKRGGRRGSSSQDATWQEPPPQGTTQHEPAQDEPHRHEPPAL